MDKHRKALELAGHAGCILLKNGAEIFRVQETMTRILCAYGVTSFQTAFSPPRAKARNTR